MTSGLDSLLVAAEYLEKLEQLNGNKLLSLENTSCNFPYTATDESNGSSSGSGSDGVGGSTPLGMRLPATRKDLGDGASRPDLSSSYPPAAMGADGGVTSSPPMDSNLALSVQFHSYSSVNYPPPNASSSGGNAFAMASSASGAGSMFASAPSLIPKQAYSSAQHKKRQHSITSASSIKSSASNRSNDRAAGRNGTGRTRTDSEQSSSSYSRHREMHKNLEKHRRAQMRQCFDALRRELPPNETTDKKTSHINIIRCAIRTIQQHEHAAYQMEHEIDRLAREKIEKQQILHALKDDLLDLGLSVLEIDNIDQDAERRALRKMINDPDRILGTGLSENAFFSSGSSNAKSAPVAANNNIQNNGGRPRARNSASISSNSSAGRGGGRKASTAGTSSTSVLVGGHLISTSAPVGQNPIGVIQMAPAASGTPIIRSITKGTPPARQTQAMILSTNNLTRNGSVVNNNFATPATVSGTGIRKMVGTVGTVSSPLPMITALTMSGNNGVVDSSNMMDTTPVSVAVSAGDMSKLTGGGQFVTAANMKSYLTTNATIVGGAGLGQPAGMLVLPVQYHRQNGIA